MAVKRIAGPRVVEKGSVKVEKTRISRDVGHFEIRYGRSYIIVAYNLRSGVFRIDGIFVMEKERGKGLGSALVGMVEDIARYLGIKYITTSTAMPEAMRFWERLGYRKIEDKATGLAMYVKQLSN